MSPATRFALRFIETYQTQVSARLSTSCKFDPTCSEYSRQVYLREGFVRGTAKTIRRLRRCRGGPAPVISDPV